MEKYQYAYIHKVQYNHSIKYIFSLGWRSGQSQQTVNLSPERAAQVRILVPAQKLSPS